MCEPIAMGESGRFEVAGSAWWGQITACIAQKEALLPCWWHAGGPFVCLWTVGGGADVVERIQLQR